MTTFCFPSLIAFLSTFRIREKGASTYVALETPKSTKS